MPDLYINKNTGSKLAVVCGRKIELDDGRRIMLDQTASMKRAVFKEIISDCLKVEIDNISVLKNQNYADIKFKVNAKNSVYVGISVTGNSREENIQRVKNLLNELALQKKIQSYRIYMASERTLGETRDEIIQCLLSIC